MITLADLLSLLVSFFALLYATTATDPATWNRVVKPISTYLTGQPDAPGPVSEFARASRRYAEELCRVTALAAGRKRSLLCRCEGRGG